MIHFIERRKIKNRKEKDKKEFIAGIYQNYRVNYQFKRGIFNDFDKKDQEVYITGSVNCYDSKHGVNIKLAGYGG
jgi:hypothetical protein